MPHQSTCQSESTFRARNCLSRNKSDIPLPWTDNKNCTNLQRTTLLSRPATELLWKAKASEFVSGLHYGQASDKSESCRYNRESLRRASESHHGPSS